MDKYLFLLIILICLSEAIAMTCVKKYHNGDGRCYIYFAIIMYAIVCFLLNQSLNFSDTIGMTNVIWSGISVMLVTLVGVIVFHEELHFHDVIAASLITVGMLILKFTK